jgi:dihydroneopterin aldolase
MRNISGLSIPDVAEQPAARAMDVIFIEGFVGQTVIGICESELRHPQPICIDLQAGLPRSRACDTDRIADTIDYALVRERLHRLLVEHRLQLLEAFAEAVAGILITEFGACWARVKVAKPRKFDDVGAMGVQIERTAPGSVPSPPLNTPSGRWSMIRPT